MRKAQDIVYGPDNSSDLLSIWQKTNQKQKKTKESFQEKIKFQKISLLKIPSSSSNSREEVGAKILSEQAQNSDLSSEGNCGRIIWNYEMELTMLQSVSVGQKWRQIAQIPIFKGKKIDHNSIKRRFESDMRRKFRALFREAYKDTKQVHITDKTYKVLLSPLLVQEQIATGNITFDEALLINQNIDFFRLPDWTGQQKATRGKQSGKKLLQKIQCDTCITDLVNAVIALQNSLPQSRGFKLNDDCLRKRQRKRTLSQKSERKKQFVLSRECMISECYHSQMKKLSIGSQKTNSGIQVEESMVDSLGIEPLQPFYGNIISQLDHQFEFNKKRDGDYDSTLE